MPGGPLPTCPVKMTDKFGNPFEENQGTTIADADIDKAILPLLGRPVGVPEEQLHQPDPRQAEQHPHRCDPDGSDLRHPLVATPLRWNTNGNYELDYVNGTNPNGVVDDTNTTLVNGASAKATGFAGVRFLFNVVDSTNALSKGPAVGLVGFDNTPAPTFKSPLCNNVARTSILTFGFAPLTTTGGGAANRSAPPAGQVHRTPGPDPSKRPGCPRGRRPWRATSPAPSGALETRPRNAQHQPTFLKRRFT